VGDDVTTEFRLEMLAGLRNREMKMIIAREGWGG
jgi:hypothetical protein